MDFKPISAETSDLISSAAAQTVLANTNLSVQTIDTRQWASYYLRVAPSVTGAPTVQNSFQVLLSWFSDPIGTATLYQDAYEFWTPQAAGGTGADTSSFLPFTVQDNMHGPFMNILLFNPTGGNTQTVSYDLFGTTRVLNRPVARQWNSFGAFQAFNGGDGQLVQASSVVVNTGTTVRIPALYGHGRAIEELVAGLGGLTINRSFGSQAQRIFDITLAANGSSRLEIVVPKRSMLYTVSNSSGTNSGISIHLISQFDKEG